MALAGGTVTNPEDLGISAAELLTHLNVPSVVLVTQCEKGLFLVVVCLSVGGCLCC